MFAVNSNPKPRVAELKEMRTENGFKKDVVVMPGPLRPADRMLHPTWFTFIDYCAELQHGEIEILKIQDGLPVFAEITKKKIKFAP